MIITRKLFALLSLIQSNDKPNQKLLSGEYKKLVELFNYALIPEFFPSTIKASKSNQIYTFFDLPIDPKIFEKIVVNIVDYRTIEALLSGSLEISYSEQEKIILNKRLERLKLLFNLETDLKKITKVSKKYKHMSKSFFDNYFHELKYLKYTLTRTVTIDDIEWLIHTNIFDFMLTESEIFTVQPTHIYQIMIKNTEQHMSKKTFNEHCQALLNKKTQTGQLFNYRAFFSILYHTKHPLSRHLNRPLSIYKFPKLRNKLLRFALKNHFYRFVNKR